MKKALVTSRTLTNQWGEEFASVSQNLVQYLSLAGYSSILLSKKSVQNLDDFIGSFNPDLVVLSGGESLGEDLVRDSFEISLINLAMEKRIPVLGICRGMQVIGSFFGQKPIQIEGHAGTRHLVSGVIAIEVNSFHNYGFEQVVRPLIPLVEANDGTIEAFRHESLPWLGIMWHPEREAPEKWDNVLRFIL